MAVAIKVYGQMAVCALAALSLSACATGQGSFVAGSGGGGGDGAFEEAFMEDAPLDEAAPGLLAASGNALLPGARSLSSGSGGVGAPTAVNRPNLLSTGPIAANIDASVNLLNGAPSANLTTGLNSSLASANINANLGGPLLALNGSRSALLGLGVTGPTVLGATPSLALSLGGTINPATAATQTLINASVGVTQQPAAPGQPTTGKPPLLPPALGVPGLTPLQTLLPLLTAPSPTTPVLPGLLGR